MVFGIGSDDFNRDMLQACEEESLPHPGLQEQEFFLIGEIEDVLQEVDGGRRLLQEELDG